MRSGHTLCAVEGCRLPKHATTPEGPLCNTHYKAWHRAQPDKCSVPRCRGTACFAGVCRRHEPTLIERDRNLAATLERFAGSIRAYAGHWLWTGAMNEDFYPTFSVNGLKWYAHRWAYGYFNGAHTSRQELDHVCGIGLCVRPDHLFPVGKKENIRLRDRRLLMPDAWITPRNYQRIWTPRADEFAIQQGLPAPVYDLAA